MTRDFTANGDKCRDGFKSKPTITSKLKYITNQPSQRIKSSSPPILLPCSEDKQQLLQQPQYQQQQLVPSSQAPLAKLMNIPPPKAIQPMFPGINISHSPPMDKFPANTIIPLCQSKKGAKKGTTTDRLSAKPPSTSGQRKKRLVKSSETWMPAIPLGPNSTSSISSDGVASPNNTVSNPSASQNSLTYLHSLSLPGQTHPPTSGVQ